MPGALFVIHDTVWHSALQEIDTIIGKVRSRATTVTAFS
jgi:hypothetical protein